MSETELNPTLANPEPTMMVPICPYCEADPAPMTSANTIFRNGMVVAVIFCSACRKIHTVQIVGQQPPAIVPATKTPLWKPS